MDQKLENILNLALETPEEEREQTESLNVGYSAESRSWELIVKYHGSLDGLREQNIVVEELIAGYAILTVPETLVDTVSETPEMWRSLSGFTISRQIRTAHPAFHR